MPQKAENIEIDNYLNIICMIKSYCLTKEGGHDGENGSVPGVGAHRVDQPGPGRQGRRKLLGHPATMIEMHSNNHANKWRLQLIIIIYNDVYIKATKNRGLVIMYIIYVLCVRSYLINYGFMYIATSWIMCLCK